MHENLVNVAELVDHEIMNWCVYNLNIIVVISLDNIILHWPTSNRLNNTRDVELNWPNVGPVPHTM